MLHDDIAALPAEDCDLSLVSSIDGHLDALICDPD